MKRAILALLLLLLPREAHANNSCVEQSDIVGDRVCGRYGDRWSTERTYPLVIATGLWSGHVVPSLHSWRTSVGKDNPTRFALDGRELGISSVNDVGMDFRLHGFATKHMYVGMDWAIALGRVHTKVAPQEGFEFRDKGSVNYAHVRFAGVIGGRLPLGPLSARLEALVGLQIVSISMEARKMGGDWVSASATSAGLILEPRLAVDVWTTPWSTLTAWGGMSVIYPADRTMGLSIALHGRAFDGRF